MMMMMMMIIIIIIIIIITQSKFKTKHTILGKTVIMTDKYVYQNSVNTINNLVQATPIFIREVCKVAKYGYHLVMSICPSTQNNPAHTGRIFMFSIFLNLARNIKCG
jgi:hypothetical protein